MNEQDINFGGIDLGSTDVPEDFDPFGTGSDADECENVTPFAAANTSASAAQPPQSDDDNDDEPITEDENPLVQAMAAAVVQEVEASKGSLFSKLPKFDYAGASEDITDQSKTFEDLRLEKSGDFPELEDGKRVSWSVEYGKITKQVSDPKGTTIAKMKTRIEKSKEFLDSLKKTKQPDRDKVVCKIKPRVTAQSKGRRAAGGNDRSCGDVSQFPPYKELCATVEDAENSDKIICFIPSQDGKVYEMRKNEIGTFVTPASNVAEFSEVKAGFFPALPRIPMDILRQIIGFFRQYMTNTSQFEALVNIVWDKELQRYEVVVPRQTVSKITVHATLEESVDSKRYIHVMDIHSHNSMSAKFSAVDDADEKATRIYAVIGRLDRYLPEINVRISNGGKYLPIDPDIMFEELDTVCPYDWRTQVALPEETPRLASGWFGMLGSGGEEA